MNAHQAYMLMDDPAYYAEMYGEVTVEDAVAAAKFLALQPAILMTAPGRVGRNVEHTLLTYADVEEDF